MFAGAGSTRAAWPSVFLTHENGIRQALIAKLMALFKSGI
jgi:hypothetical protein